MSKPILIIDKLEKNYEQELLLDNVSLTLSKNETLCLLGPSGSGKSTLLRIIAGLEHAESGRIFWKGLDLAEIPINKRNFGLMFQDFALFPHLTVYENVAFGPKMKGWEKDHIKHRVEQTLQLVKMERFVDRSVSDLSGGEKQRVALARTIAPNPELLMLDEPLGALDKRLREDLSLELREIINEIEVPAIYVTHDQEEAFTLGDRVAILNFGKILQEGEPQEIYHHPYSLWLAGFLGFENQISGVVDSISPFIVSTSIGKFQCTPQNIEEYKKDEKVILVFKSDVVASKKINSQLNLISGISEDCLFQGRYFSVKIKTKSDHKFQFISDDKIENGSEVFVRLEPSKILCYKKR